MSAERGVEVFVSQVRSSAALQEELVHVGNEIADITRFASARGYQFTALELEGYLEAAFAHLLSPAEKASYQDFQDRRRRNLVPGPKGSVGEREVTIRSHDWAPGLALDRAAILGGEIHIVNGSPAFQRLIDRLRSNLVRAFEPHPVLMAPDLLDDAALGERVRAADALQRVDPELAGLVSTLLDDLGFARDETRYERPGLRMLLPEARAGVAGYYRDVETFVLNAHRDTWYGAPFNQINVWAPLYAHAPGAGLRIFPRYFTRAIKNNTPGSSVWRARIGLNLRPMCLEAIDEHEDYFPELPVGSFVCFSANHLHGSGLNRGMNPRVSVELRLINDSDRAAERAAPNVDHSGLGEIYEGWSRPEALPPA